MSRFEAVAKQINNLGGYARKAATSRLALSEFADEKDIAGALKVAPDWIVDEFEADMDEHHGHFV